MLKIGYNKCSSNDYHADREFLSSSVLKTIYKSLADYHDQYILGNKKEFSASSQAAMAEGSLCHTMLLEPHLVDSEFAFYPDWTKRGAAYEQFAALHEGKTVISVPQQERVNNLISAYKKHPVAPTLLKGGEAEQTICGEISGVKIKTRYDYVNPELGAIYDIKTTAYPGDRESFKLTIEQLSYQLSAALYCRIAEQHYGKPFKFYFIVLSKKDQTCNVYCASERTIAAGNAMINKAILKFKAAKESGIWDESTEENSISSEIEEV